MKELIDQLVSEIASRVVEAVEKRVSSAPAAESSPEAELNPFHLYTASEAAGVLGLDRATMYEIPETELPRCEIGPARGATRWMGADLLAYAKGLDPVDYEQMLEELREKLTRSPESLTGEEGEGQTRVM